ncbi:hypothetical protein PoB_005823900 [Plakobranchus ocellatus]|uniref:Uncharacterized protein n=1 Tax=Plakobranchus ocellatus TaxID=259542 RepID=A0AAV4CKM1_9GAST|nr:hypothetical protein PoB_005823900 [Plakobranchus ocellatus]
MEQELSPDIKPDVYLFLFEQKPDVQNLAIKAENQSSDSQTNQDMCPLTEQKSEITLHFPEDELSIKSAASHKHTPISPISKRASSNSKRKDYPDLSEEPNQKIAKSELDDQAPNEESTEEEKPCIAALRALVEAYSRREGENGVAQEEGEAFGQSNSDTAQCETEEKEDGESSKQARDTLNSASLIPISSSFY